MVKVIDGDLLESGADIIAHQVNCFTMGSGVAGQIKKKWKEVFECHQNLVNSYKDKRALLGTTQSVCVDGKYHIVNMFAQYNYGYDGRQYTDISALKNCLVQLKNDAILLENFYGRKVRVALPYEIGCRRGGASWSEVLGIIEEIFSDYEIELWRFDKG